MTQVIQQEVNDDIKNGIETRDKIVSSIKSGFEQRLNQYQLAIQSGLAPKPASISNVFAIVGEIDSVKSIHSAYKDCNEAFHLYQEADGLVKNWQTIKAHEKYREAADQMQAVALHFGQSADYLEKDVKATNLDLIKQEGAQIMLESCNKVIESMRESAVKALNKSKEWVKLIPAQ